MVLLASFWLRGKQPQRQNPTRIYTEIARIVTDQIGLIAGRIEDSVSQRSGFSQDLLLKVWTESSVGQDLDFSAEKFRQILFETDDVEKGTSRLDVHKQINVTVGPIIAARDRSEYTYVTSAIVGSQGQNFRTSCSQLID